MELNMRNLYRYCFLICLVALAGIKPASAQVCPCTIWASSAAPAVVDGGDTAPVEIGVKFRSDVAGFVTGIRFYKGTANTGTHIGHLWNGSGTLLATGTFSGETSTGWQQVNFTSPVAVSANVTYVASYFAPNGHYSFDQNIFTSAGIDSPPLHALAAGVDGPNGVYAYGSTSAFPTSTFNSSNYWVDAVFSMTSAPAGPTVTSFTPANGSATSSVTTAVTATFAGSVDATTVTSSTFQLHDSLNTLVAASVTYDGPSRTATLQPSAPLAAGTNYTAVVVGGAATSTVKDLSGVSMAASVTWSFATAPAPGGCPCTIWPVTTTPAVVDSGDGVGVELGVRFRTDISGYIYGIRFYRSTANGGTHQGSLWTNTGTLLATATFTGETTSGWQQVNFSSPVAVTSGTTYVASYYTTTGHYSVDAGFFTSSGADAPPLHALPDNLDGNDGVYSYSPVSAFPVSTFGAGNYWVDVVFDTASPAPTVTTFSPANGAASVNTATAITATFSTAIDPATLSSATFAVLDGVGNTVSTSLSYNPATFTATAQPSAALAAATSYTASLPAGGVKTPSGAGLAAGVTWSFMTASASAPPSVLSFSPPAGASGVATTTGVTATFSKAMDPTTINGTSFQLLGPGNTVVSAVLSYNSSNFTATLQPSSALSPLTSYTAIVRGGLVKDTQGNALPGTVSWSFTTVTGPPPPPTNCPCTLWSAATTPGTVDSADPAGVEVGVKFRSDAAGLVTGLRFYKSALNLGTHVGNLWSSSGTLMSSVTFTNESASGWQQVNFASPVAVTANTVYVASYFAPQGHYSVTANAFTNLGVDNPPLHALANGVSGSNGVYTYGTSSAFPSSSFNSGNYWVDVVFVLNNSTNPPTVQSVAPAAGSSGASVGMAISASFNEPMNPATINTAGFQLVDVSNNVISGTVSYDSPSASIVFTPSGGLLSQTTYTATVNTSVKDIFGNALAQAFQWSFTTAPPPANTGPGGPILVISSSQNPYTRYLGEILLNEGLNEFTVQDISTVTAATLATYDIAILGDMTLAPSQVSMLTSWVTGGGKLIAMHPDKQLAGLLGLASTPNTLSNQYLAVNTLTGPGVGIVPDSIQFHGPADLYTLSGATAYATLYSSVTTPTSAPAVSWVNTGAGQAAAFVYDLARSVVWTRQGNPAWSGQQRNGFIDPTSGQSFFQIRSDDLYYGNSSSDPQPDWVNLDKVQIPQADEQQRLLVNLIEQMNASTRPLPRFWYLPSGFKAAVLMTGDDHGNGGTSGRFDQYIAASPANCSVADWACVRGTSYVWPYTSIPNYVSYISKGFEIANHADNAPTCTNWTPASLTTAMTNQLTGDSGFASYFPQAPAPRTNRTHCVLWSDYDSEPQIELSFGIRLDTTYYYWPQGWIQDRPGMFTGSGMPMRFADRNGNTIDVYQATTQMPDESLQTFPFTIDTMLDNAVGPKGFYGVFTANMHTDYVQSDGSDAIVASAKTHGVPIVTALQMLTWLDGRNNSSFGSISWSSNVLSFTVTAATGSRNLMAMVPATAPGVMLKTLKLNGTTVSFTQQTIKGIPYASFSASTGSYQATYAPVFSISGTITGPGASGATVSVTGTATASTTASSTGQYSITNLFAGSYTVTPFKSGFTFSPTNQAVTVNANVTGVNFSSIVTPTFSISGTVSGAGGSAAVLTLSGAGSATTVANASGVYSLNGVPAGSYTVTPAKSGYLFTPTSTNVTVSSANISGINFTSTAATSTTLAMDANVSADLGTTSTSITSPTLSTTVGNELLLAFIAADNFGTGAPTSVTSVSGGGLTWVLVQQTNAELGTSEIWRAFAPAPLTNVAVTANFNDDVPESSITVVTFTGVDFSGTNGSGAIGAVGTGSAANGAPTASLVTTRPNSWVFGVGNDYDNAIARTPASGQTLVHQFLGPADSTYWVQRQNSTTSTKGTLVRINDTSPGSDRYNLSTVEILAIQPPIASLSPSSVPFGIQVVNTTSNPSVVTLTNTGNGILLINSITIAGTNATDFAKTTTCGSSLAVGANCTISLTFRPGATGSRTGTLSITDNAAGSPHNVNMTGTGTGVTVTPTSLAFGSQNVGTTSAAQTVALKNVGTATLTSIAISLTGTNIGDYAQTNTCTTTLAVGATCNISVTFKPTNTGSRTATLRIADSDPTSPQQITLTGTGTTPVASLTPTTVPFGIQPVNVTTAASTVTLRNTGTGTMTINGVSIAGTNASDFAETTTCGTTLAAGANCTISVTFRPGATGARSGTLSVSDNAAGSPHNTTLTGTGTGVTVSPTSVAFGNQNVGTTSTAQTVTLNNVGTTTLTSIAISLTGTNLGDYAQTNNCAPTLAVGTSCSISVTFTPTASGSRTATLRIANSDPTSPQQVSLTGTGTSPVASLTPTTVPFGIQPVNVTSTASTVTLRNTGNGTMTINGVSIAGTNASDFAQTTTCGTTLAAGATCTISVTFTPGATGSRTGTLSVSDNAAGSPHNATLTGTGTGVTVTPTSLTFASQTRNTTSPAQIVTLRNVGTATLTSIVISLTGTNPGDYAQTNTCGSTLAAGASCTISVTFRPTFLFTRTATLRIADSDPATPQQVNLTGTGR